MTLPQSSVSPAKNLAASAGVPIMGSSRRSRSFALTTGCCRISTTSRLMRAASAAGSAGGPTMANQVIERNPGNPDSAMVGMSGRVGARSSPATAMMRILSA